MPSPARVVLFVLLLITAVVALRVPAAGTPVAAADRTPATVVVWWLIALATPALLVLLYAGLRHRSPRRRAVRPQAGRPRVRPALLALAALLVVTAALTVLARLLPPAALPTATSRGDRAPEAPTGPAPPAEPAGGTTGGSAVELAATAVAVALLSLLAVAVLRARRPEPGDVASPDATAPSARAAPQPLATAAGAALAAVDKPGSDPRAAIIGCYAAMERALAEAPASAPRPADTPADVLRRATEQGQLSPGVGTLLLRLFHEARYSTHPMTDADRGVAAATLRAILTDLGRPRWRPS